MVNDDVEVVAIDEIQFFDKDIVDVCEYLADKGIRVIVAGLDKVLEVNLWGDARVPYSEQSSLLN